MSVLQLPSHLAMFSVSCNGDGDGDGVVLCFLHLCCGSNWPKMTRFSQFRVVYFVRRLWFSTESTSSSWCFGGSSDLARAKLQTFTFHSMFWSRTSLSNRNTYIFISNLLHLQVQLLLNSPTIEPLLFTLSTLHKQLWNYKKKSQILRIFSVSFIQAIG